ncbi:MAG: hypothetical protein BMS9Abin25_0386 [Gammaproteobacteria bacterium]|nr:MAG: hypothetical protein BMS9Abin25_0386 [Gammaproteobacteria bacterium]
MIRLLISALLYTLANAVGLFLAILLLPGFSMGPISFVIATLIFTVIEVVMGPLVMKISIKSAPALAGGIALVTTFFGLFITSILVDGMSIGGLSNWLAATLLVWVGALVAGMILPVVAFKKIIGKK